MTTTNAPGTTPATSATAADGVPPAPRWAVAAAWGVPLCILPSALWRLSVVGSHRDAGWYLVLLSGLSLGLGALTLGLVQRWGERFPPRLVLRSASTGAALLVGIFAYGGLNAVFHLVDRGPVLVGRDEPATPPPGWDVGVWYLPLLLWPVLLLAVSRDYRRRHPRS